MINFLPYYPRVTRSLLLITAKAIKITSTTSPPETKLPKKFPNEAVISKISFSL